MPDLLGDGRLELATQATEAGVLTSTPPPTRRTSTPGVLQFLSD